MDTNQIEALWIKNGGPPAWAPLMAGIAIAESGGNTTSLNNNPATGDYSVGLWQINYFGGMLGPRSQKYGTPTQLQASPDAQAKAAIDLFGQNGAGLTNWTNDKTWKAWVAAGHPQAPSHATVATWLNNSGTMSDPAGGGNANGAPSAAPPGAGCNSKSSGISLLGSTSVGTACQLKALTGGLLIGVGGLVLLVGTILIVANGLVSTSAGRAAVGLAGGGGPVGTVARGLSGGARGLSSRRQANIDQANYDQYETNAPAIAQRNAGYRAKELAAARDDQPNRARRLPAPRGQHAKAEPAF